MEAWITLAGVIGSLLVSIVSLVIALKKTPHETEKLDADAGKSKAEADSIHQQVADRWAEHVDELVKKINALEDQREADRKEIAGLRMDISQVRRENEEYRRENSDLTYWAERLFSQLREHAPEIEPAKFIRRSMTYSQE